MTNREFYTAIINHEISDEVILHAQTEIGNLDRKNEKRRNTLSKEQIANEAIKAEIFDFLSANGAQVASAVGTAVGQSTQKASALLRQLVAEGRVEMTAITVKGKGTVKQYKAV